MPSKIFSDLNFSSIKWKFIGVYLILVFIAMAIAGVFITDRIERQQIEDIKGDMNTRVESILNFSTYLLERDWEESKAEIQKTLDQWRLSGEQDLFIISIDGQLPKDIIASSLKKEEIIGSDAFSYEGFEPSIILTALQGEKGRSEIKDIDNTRKLHLAYPVEDDRGNVKGIIYLTHNLRFLENTLKESKRIFINGTYIALGITLLLGYLIASSIIEPISDLTDKVEEMSEGDFKQTVDVKSDDEIGQLASMFNQLTRELDLRIGEIELERSKLNTIFNSMAEGVIAIDDNYRLIHANPIAIKLLNIDTDLFYSGADIFIDFSDYNLDDVSLGQQEEEIYKISGEFYKIKHAPYEMDEKDRNGVILVFQNLTDEYRLDEVRREFVANVSHELKTPLTTIKSYTETLMDDKLDRELEMRFLNVIVTEIDRMDRLVRDLLRLSNLDYKDGSLNKQQTDLNELVKDIVDKMAIKFHEAKITYSFDFDRWLPKVNIDRDGIEQVIVNILSNSINYAPEWSHIDIGTIQIENYATIIITDQGIGISEEDIDRIFERFYRVDKARDRDSGGTGLGLAIAKEVVESHHGEIKLYSKENIGTKVEIKLPISNS